MESLFLRSKSSAKRLLAAPFKTEAEFEQTVFDSADLLEDVFLLKRQVRGGAKNGIPDIIGVDRDGNICIVEMKNVTVDEAIIPQVLQYAIWAESNPDSIKTLWLECDTRPDDLEIEWDRFGVRILIVAPLIQRSTLAFAEKINYQIDLVEVRRWTKEDEQLLLVNKIEAEPKKTTKPVSGLATYDDAFYRSEYNDQSVDVFLRLADEINALVAENGWGLERKFNKGYCGFKNGFFNVFGVIWRGTRALALFFKLSEKEARETGIELSSYDPGWKQAYVFVTPDTKIVLADLLPLFVAAYTKSAGK